ncbi:MAG: hypothetical protein JSW46_19475 [Gemmatimonadota bacterium]|nr:MAG: hypothetical protein JSW46_19475 [Gemmatimonadota bacterium]
MMPRTYYRYFAWSLTWAVAGTVWAGTVWGQQVAFERTRGAHLQISYPAAEAAKATSFLSDAERVYTCVDSLLKGALPAAIEVRLERERTDSSSDSTLVVTLMHESLMGHSLARGLVRVGGRELVGPAFDMEGVRFFAGGLETWAASRCRPVREEPYWLRAAYAHMEEATYLEYLEFFERASEEVGRPVIAAAGYAFVDHLAECHGLEALQTTLTAMSDNADVCLSLDAAGLGCEAFLDGWWAALDAEAAKHDFSLLPRVHADLLVSGQGELRELSLWVRIVNPEAESYQFYVSLIIDGERSEEPFNAEGSDFSGQVPLGQVSLGAKVMWDVAVWSEMLKLWRRSGWQDQIVR